MQEVHTTRQFREENGVIYCDRRGCPGSTGLRCYRTGVPICKKCSVHTDVGYLSIDAARAQQNLAYSAGPADYALAGVSAFAISLAAGLIIAQLWYFFALFLAFPIGGSIGEAAFRVMRRRRGRYTAQVIGTAIALAVIILLVMYTRSFLSLGIYGVIAISTATARVQLRL